MSELVCWTSIPGWFVSHSVSLATVLLTTFGLGAFAAVLCSNAAANINEMDLLVVVRLYQYL
eukprot:6222579-Amphidinium_carterae.1